MRFSKGHVVRSGIAASVARARTAHNQRQPTSLRKTKTDKLENMNFATVAIPFWFLTDCIFWSMAYKLTADLICNFGFAFRNKHETFNDFVESFALSCLTINNIILSIHSSDIYYKYVFIKWIVYDVVYSYFCLLFIYCPIAGALKEISYEIGITIVPTHFVVYLFVSEYRTS